VVLEKNSDREAMSNPTWLDGALYPDTDVPETLETIPDQVDFLARLCSAC